MGSRPKDLQKSAADQRLANVRPAAVLCLLAVTLVACRPSSPLEPIHLIDERGRRALAVPVALPTKLDALIGGQLRLVGASVPARAKPGERLPVTLAFVVEEPLTGAPPRSFVHATAPGAEGHQAQADHELLGGRVPTREWLTGDIVMENFELSVPMDIGVDQLILRAGLYQGDHRWPVTPQAAHDGRDRIEVARVHIDGAPPLQRKVDVPKRRKPIIVDGRLDVTEWAGAATLGPFLPTDGRSTITRKTSVRMQWDEQALWLAFDVEDPDVFTLYAKHDEPLYESEATELFIDADGDRDVYVELQSAADDVHFDAAFAGGSRKNMDKEWNASFETRTVRTPRGYTAEWRVPVAALRDIPAGEPRIGAAWQLNLFRLERIRVASKDGAVAVNAKVARTEASAWSPPLSGDFHNLTRFGTITFVDAIR